MKTKLRLSAICQFLSAICASALTQNTTFTCQGRITDSGTNFSGIGQFKFALVTAVPSSG
jgi:hypothetical protein